MIVVFLVVGYCPSVTQFFVIKTRRRLTRICFCLLFTEKSNNRTFLILYRFLLTIRTSDLTEMYNKNDCCGEHNLGNGAMLGLHVFVRVNIF